MAPIEAETETPPREVETLRNEGYKGSESIYERNIRCLRLLPSTGRM